MEALLSANDDFLVDPLSLTLKKGATYIVNRRSATFFSSVNSASYRGVQTVKFAISSQNEWADPESMILSFDVVNDDADKPLQFSTVGAHCLWERYQCRMSSTEVENIEHYGRTVECFSRLIPAEKRLNEGALGFGTKTAMKVSGTDVAPNMFIAGDHEAKQIPGGGRKRVFMRLPLSGVFSSAQKYLPLWALGSGGVEVLLSLANPAAATIHTHGGSTMSQTYHLEDLRAEIDLVTLASEVSDRYWESLAQGGAMYLHPKLWDITQVYISPSNSGNADITLTKSLSRLATMFVNFAPELSESDIQGGKMYVNTFTAYPDAAETLESFTTIGSKRYPDFSVKGITAHFWKLVQALGVAKSLPHSVNTDMDSYSSNSFAMGVDFEKCPLAASTGTNTKGGQELRVSVKGFRSAAGEVPRRAWVCLHHEAALEIKANGVTLLD